MAWEIHAQTLHNLPPHECEERQFANVEPCQRDGRGQVATQTVICIFITNIDIMVLVFI